MILRTQILTAACAVLLTPAITHAQLHESAIAALAGSTAQPASPFPASITQTSAKVYSGPGREYYATAIIPEGATVEVHRVVGGYLGIRPLEASFSWASGDAIDEVAPGIGVVMRDELPSYVGSRVIEQRDAIHVRMNKGERVRILSCLMIDGEEWVQISPPAGEFRWIKLEAIAPQPMELEEVESEEIAVQPPAGQVPTVTVPFEIETAEDRVEAPSVELPAEQLAEAPAWSASSASGEEALEAETPVVEQQPEAVAEAFAVLDEPDTTIPAEPARFVADAKPLSGWVSRAAHDRASPATTSQPAASPVVGSLAPTAPPVAASPVTPKPIAPSTISPSPQTSLTPVTETPAASGTFASQLDALEMELSRRVTQPSHLWQLDDIEIAASRLIAATQLPGERAAAGALAARAGRFASIARRTCELTGVAPRVSLTKSPPIAPASSPVAPPAVAANPSYNAVGELRAVVSKRPDAPRFALVDERGRVTSFVTPPAGVDLQPLIGRRVAVSGAPGYMPRLRTPHVAAARVDAAPGLVR